MDVWGPYSTASVHGHKYFLTMVDDFSRFTWLILLKGKHELATQVQNFIHLVENQFDSKVKIVRNDNGPEFSIPSFYASKGIIHQTSCVYTPQQNGRAERKHQCILAIARALLIQSHLPPKYWGYAVLHAAYLMNRMSSMAIAGDLPYNKLHSTYQTSLCSESLVVSVMSPLLMHIDLSLTTEHENALSWGTSQVPKVMLLWIFIHLKLLSPEMFNLKS
jgi:hypothetical protein